MATQIGRGQIRRVPGRAWASREKRDAQAESTTKAHTRPLSDLYSWQVTTVTPTYQSRSGPLGNRRRFPIFQLVPFGEINARLGPDCPDDSPYDQTRAREHQDRSGYIQLAAIRYALERCTSATQGPSHIVCQASMIAIHRMPFVLQNERGLSRCASRHTPSLACSWVLTRT